MNNKEKNTQNSPSRVEMLIRVLADQRRALVTAGCDTKISEDYASLIKFLKSASPIELNRVLPALPTTRGLDFQEPEQTEAEILEMSAGDVEKFVSDENTSRKYLERIAIHRFRVPRGSMRSFSNRQMLVEKLMTLLRNEQSHGTIETVARGQAELRGARIKE